MVKKKDFSGGSPRKLRVLSLDIGSKRIGTAFWNPEAELARPLHTIHRKKLKLDLEAIAKIIKEEEAQALLIGMPVSLNENITESTRNAQFWMDLLTKEFGLPMFSVDESFSTHDAVELLLERGVKLTSKTMKEKKDSLAASVFLEEFMNGQV